MILECGAGGKLVTSQVTRNNGGTVAISIKSWVRITFYTNKKQHINYFRINTRLSTARTRLTPHLFWVRFES